MGIWVCKFDGTIQCDEDSKEITLAEMRKDLASMIGEDNILDMKKQSGIMIKFCGMPTGLMNSYEITESGHSLLFHGIRGSGGFVVCPGHQPSVVSRKGESAEKDELVEKNKLAIGYVLDVLAKSNPDKVSNLVGNPVRIYTTGDFLTEDFVFNRINIETDSKGIIVRTWFG